MTTKPPTYVAAIDSENPAVAVYGIGTTERRAFLDAQREGQVEAGDDESSFRYVSITPRARRYVLDRDGGGSGLSITRRGVCLRSEGK